MHFADTFIQSDLHCIQGIDFIIPWDRTHKDSIASAIPTRKTDWNI